MSDSVQKDPYNRGGMWAFIFCMAFSFCFFIWISFIHPGVDLNEVKEIKEQMKQDMAKAGIVAKKIDMAGIASPWQSSEEVIGHGKAVYDANCAVCHGNTGMGDGPAGKAIGARDLVEGAWKVGGDRISLFNTLAQGIAGTGMAAFPQIEVADRWAMVHYIRKISQNAPKDDDASVEKFAKSAK